MCLLTAEPWKLGRKHSRTRTPSSSPAADARHPTGRGRSWLLAPPPAREPVGEGSGAGSWLLLPPETQWGGGGADSWLLLPPETQWGRGRSWLLAPPPAREPVGEGRGAGSWLLLPPETQWGWGGAGSSSHRRPAGRGRSWLLAPSPARDPVGRERRWLLVLPPAKAHFPSTFRPSDGCHTQEASLMQDRWHLSHSFF